MPLIYQPNTTPIVTTRAEIRKQLRLRRQQLSATVQHHASLAIAHNLGNSQLFRNSQRIAGFLSNDSEPDLTALMQLAWQQKKQWHLPII
ncbi:MAG TPA: 5-formyltetrahydrofolate cyclo-ligase, partial [Candidatus Tenderia electrophaga]|nr:5-formyltetrahydrofolate cyclo-ligase [Candidatus Tenderia electrophaga]